MSALDRNALLAILAAVLETPLHPHSDTTPEPSPSSRDAGMVARLLAGDEAAFERLVGDLQPLLLRLAATVVRSGALAEEVVQDTWLAVLQGLPSFAGRSSLKTWIVRILFNRARTRAVREVRSVPFSALRAGDDDSEPELFAADGAWRAPPSPWGEHVTPERLLSDAELRALVERAIETLPEQQRLVIELRDVAQLDSAEVCQLLQVSEANQRVLLHRARHKVRAAIAPRLGL
jgi:RNA polymerase sigma-70 factor (ECF subfamily)